MPLAEHILHPFCRFVTTQAHSTRQRIGEGTNWRTGVSSLYWDRDIDLIIASSAGAESLNGLLAVVDRYQVRAIASVEVEDNRAAREWLDMMAAKQIEVIEAGLGIGIEDGIALTLDKSGWVQIDAGATSAGIGTSGRDARVDVSILDEVTDQTAAWLQSAQPAIVVTGRRIEAPEGTTVVDAQQNSVELVFDGARWAVRTSP